MEAIRLVSLPTPDRPEHHISVEGDRLTVDHLVIVDGQVAAFLGERVPEERPALLERALRIGVTALQDAGVSLDVDVVRREFEGLVRQAEVINERAATALDGVLRQNFADDDGRLPRTLERFLGDRGQLRAFVTELFDETRRDSAMGRMRAMLGSYFDGDASRLAQLLDPTRLGSPLHQFRTEVSDGFAKLNDRLTAIEAAGAARASERARSAAKGADFEAVIGDLLADVCRGTGDAVDRTGDEAGAVIRSKKGDFVLSLDAGLTRGADVRVVIECKDRAISGKEMRAELAEAKRNRGAQVGLVVFTPQHAPAGIAPFDVRLGDVYCVVDPAEPEPAVLDAAVRLARLHALATLAEREVEVDAAAIGAALTAIRAQLDAIRSLKMQLTSIGSMSREVGGGLDRLREGVLAAVQDVERALRDAAVAEAA
ncbi:MAG: hypothetical protein KF809_15985 [Chloroflexi bacterium]|nr:hypothetical protein [Chloroflexota bacterium]